MVKSYSYDENWDIVSDRARFKQVNSEVENVVVLARVELLREDQLVNLAHFWVQYGAIGVFEYRAILLFSQVQEDLTDQYTSIQYGWEVIREIGWIIFLCSYPIFDETCSFGVRRKRVKRLHKSQVRLLGVLFWGFTIECRLRCFRFGVEEWVLEEVLVLVDQLLD